MKKQKGLQLLGKEFKRILSDKHILIPFLAVLFIPVLYAGLFLWAFWDPYEQLDLVPVAVVNQDTGAIYGDEKLNIGEELVNKLKDNPKFDWHFVSAEESKQGLEDQEYYMTIEIPKDFSSRATTVLDDHPEKLEITFKPNEGYNFLASQIGESGMNKIAADLSSTITQTYTATIFDGIEELSQGIRDASDGAMKLSSGSQSLDEGASKLEGKLALYSSKMGEFKTGVGKIEHGTDTVKKGTLDLHEGILALGEGANELNQGTVTAYEASKQLSSGAKLIDDGISKLNTNLPTLQQGTNALEEGAGNLSLGLNQWKAGGESLQVGANQVAVGMEQAYNQLKPLLEGLPPEQKSAMEANFNTLIQASKQVVGGVSSLNNAAGQLSQGALSLKEGTIQVDQGLSQVKIGVEDLKTGSKSLYEGSEKMVAGEEKLVVGMNTFTSKFQLATNGSDQLVKGTELLASGAKTVDQSTKQLLDGANQLADGSMDLHNGSEKLKNGAKTLSSELKKGADEVGQTTFSDENAKMIASPVQVKTERFREVPNYGSGFTPYFLSLGLFVGALLMTIVYPLRQSAGIPNNALAWFISKFGVILSAGIIQSILALVFVLGGLKLEVKSIPLFMLTAFVTSSAFFALIQFLVTSFADAGRFIAILFLILQLTSCAGTFPVETIPNVLQICNRFLPMTYSVAAMKAAISTGDFAFLGANLLVLMVFVLVCSIGTILFFRMEHKKMFGSSLSQVIVEEA